jgi:hypothetical protein
MLGTLPFKNVRPICSVDAAAFAAGKLINRLPVICPGLASVAYNYLPISIHESHVRGASHNSLSCSLKHHRAAYSVTFRIHKHGKNQRRRRLLSRVLTKHLLGSY